MTKLVTYFLALTFSGFAAAGDDMALARTLYPSSQEDQAFVAKFFEIADLHKTNDPLLGGPGPGVSGYRLDQLKFAFSRMCRRNPSPVRARNMMS